MQTRPWWRTGVVLVVLATTSLVACRTPGGDPGVATVGSVIDGDTLEVTVGGRTEQVRLLGIDTPETKHPTRPVECFGPEASARLGELLPPGTEVLLFRDREPRDQFGRLLAYVERRSDQLSVNLTLVEEGYADVLIIEPNEALAPELRRAVSEARGAGLGLWSACGGPDTPAAG